MAQVMRGSLAGWAFCPTASGCAQALTTEQCTRWQVQLETFMFSAPKLLPIFISFPSLLLFWRISKELAQLAPELYLDWWQKRHSWSCMSRSKCHHLSVAEEWGLQGKNQCYLLWTVAWKVPRLAVASSCVGPAVGRHLHHPKSAWSS